MEHYCVRVSSEQMTFSAGHFITFGQDTCEPLHGHDYRVAAEMHGPLDENQCVLDFIALRDSLAEILAELDHRVLLPSESPSIRVVEGPKETEAPFADRRWVLPRGDCLVLPIANTTAELLARHRSKAFHISALTGVGLDELTGEVLERMKGETVEATIRIPQGEGKLMAEIDRRADVYNRRYLPTTVELEIRMNRTQLRQLAGRHPTLTIVKGDLTPGAPPAPDELA